jgi:hypothetical protein
VVAEPTVAFIATKALSQVDGYIAYSSQYIQKRPSTVKGPLLFDQEGTLTSTVLYAFFDTTFESDSTDTMSISATVRDSFKGTIANFSEPGSTEPRMYAGDKLKEFCKKLVDGFVRRHSLALYYGHLSRNIVECLLVTFTQSHQSYITSQFYMDSFGY